jgi:hypothetical protein
MRGRVIDAISAAPSFNEQQRDREQHRNPSQSSDGKDDPIREWLVDRKDSFHLNAHWAKRIE